MIPKSDRGLSPDLENITTPDDPENNVDPIRFSDAYSRKMAEKYERRRKKAYGEHGRIIWNSTEQGTYRKEKPDVSVE